MTKGQVSNVAASVRQRLLNIIRETGDDAWNIAAVLSRIILAARPSLKPRPKEADGV